MSDAVDDFLSGSGAPAAKFLSVGDEVKGTVLTKEMTQQTDLQGNLKTYKDGNPMMQAIITLQTEEHVDDDDDGRRRVYVNKPRMRTAISEAIRAAGGASLEVGGKLAIKYTGDGQPTERGFNPPKLFAAFYKLPDPAEMVKEAFGAEEYEYDDAPF